MVFSNLAPDAHFTTQSWIERIVVIGATKPSKVTLKAAGTCVCNILLSMWFSYWCV